MFNLGLSEIVLISIIALIFIGPKQLPEIARTIGRALNELKRASEDLTSSISQPRHYESPKKESSLSDVETSRTQQSLSEEVSAKDSTSNTDPAPKSEGGSDV